MPAITMRWRPVLLKLVDDADVSLSLTPDGSVAFGTATVAVP
jgi:hypothetical protein